MINSFLALCLLFSLHLCDSQFVHFFIALRFNSTLNLNLKWEERIHYKIYKNMVVDVDMQTKLD